MLYARWRQVAVSHPDGLAVAELGTGKRWSFRALADAAERMPQAAGVERPSGASVDFVLSVLRAWRDGRPACPVDAGQALVRMPTLPDRVAHLKLTSATTGPPRLVAFTAEQMAADVDQIVAAMGLRADWPNLGVISLAHSYGFSNLVLPLLLHGIPLLLADGPFPEAVRRAAAGWEALTLAAVPALWRTWHEADAIPECVRLAISAGAPLPLYLETAVYSRRGLKIHNFYGATECGGIGYDPGPRPRTDESWVGVPMPGVSASVAGDGCLEVRSPSVGLGYVPPEPGHLGHGRFLTRDLASVDDSGLRLLGRASDLINVAGRKLAPERVEAALLRHPAVRACIVFGVPDGDAARNERVVAVVAADAGDLPDAALRAFALRHLPAWQVPRQWAHVTEIPANARGKVSRAEWRERFLSGDIGNMEGRTQGHPGGQMERWR